MVYELRSQVGIGEETPEKEVQDDGSRSWTPPAVEPIERSLGRTGRWLWPVRELTFEGRQDHAMEFSKSQRDELYTGRHGTLPLREFEDRFLAIMADVQMRYDKYSDEYALLQMPRYLGGEAAQVFREFKNTMQVKHGSKSAKLEAGVADLSKRVAGSSSGTMVQSMFDILREEFPTDSAEKMDEVTRFAFKPGESLKSAYLRLKQLIIDTELRNPRDAAEDFLAALPIRHRAKVTGAVHLLYGKKYDLKQAYEIAERIVPADAYTAAYVDRRYGVQRGMIGPVPGTSRGG